MASKARWRALVHASNMIYGQVHHGISDFAKTVVGEPIRTLTVNERNATVVELLKISRALSARADKLRGAREVRKKKEAARQRVKK